MPHRKEIKNCVGADLLSIETYDLDLDFATFNPNTEFEKWAAVEVSDFDNIPEGLESFTIPGGQYAVFLYIGNPNAAASTFQYIFGTWLPASEYVLDQRPHFEIMGAKYKNNDDKSEEEFWVPIRNKEFSLQP